MNAAPEHPLPEDTFARIMAVAYGEASPADRLRVWRATRRDPALRRLLREHRLIANAVHDLPAPRAPEGIADRIRAEVGEPGDCRARTLPLPRRGLIWGGAAVAAACAILLASQFLPPAADPAPQYSQAEIEEARLQIEAAFAMVTRGMGKASAALQNEIFTPTVARPLRDGATILHELFGKEK
jgi:anti-sigma factor RsiW